MMMMMTIAITMLVKASFIEMPSQWDWLFSPCMSKRTGAKRKGLGNYFGL
jgi:hypothetical protein